MQFPLVFITLLATNIASGEENWWEVQWNIERELQSLNATCPPYDNCKTGRTSDRLETFNCQCTSTCARFGTCCIDSSYRRAKPPEIKPTCRMIDSDGAASDGAYFMVDRCPSNSAWEKLCEEDWTGDSDILKIVPVTSVFTHITYKNYFCFRCHETTEDFLYWQVELGSWDHKFDPSIDKGNVSVSYDYTNKTWLAALGMGGTLIPVYLDIEAPREIWSLLVGCKQNVISKCADTWKDEDVIKKCEYYMGIIYIKKNFTQLMYKNVHCALCNYEDLNKMSCSPLFGGGGSKSPFSFTHLMDVNRSDGDKVGKIQKCGVNSLWDPYSKKCRNLICALPGYVVKDGKCTPSRWVSNFE